MTHLNLEQLLALREPGLEPGVQGWRDHAAACELCRAELERLDQRVARLRSLPVLKPARNRFAEIQRRTRTLRFRRRLLLVALGGFAAAATVALAVVLSSRSTVSARLAEQRELDSIIARSQQLENVIQDYNPDRRVTDGRTAVVAASLEDRVALVDRQLELVNLMDQRGRSQEALRLWRERVGLLDALVDVHATGAKFVRY
jgi:hypothetical protein